MRPSFRGGRWICLESKAGLVLQCKEQVQTGGSMPNPRRILHPENDGSGTALVRPKPAPGRGMEAQS
jgi:hypothetical protein